MFIHRCFYFLHIFSRLSIIKITVLVFSRFAVGSFSGSVSVDLLFTFKWATPTCYLCVPFEFLLKTGHLNLIMLSLEIRFPPSLGFAAVVVVGSGVTDCVYQGSD